MADPVTWAALQVAGQVLAPVAISAMPFLWEQIEKVLRVITGTRNARDSSRATNLACINTVLDTLDRLPNRSWTSENHIQALLIQMKIKTESLSKMIKNDGTLKRFVRKSNFEKNIQSIAVMMQLLETNVRVRQATAFEQCNAILDVSADRLNLDFYTQSQGNLIRDLHGILDGDDLNPVVIETRKHYEASIKTSGTYPRIFYEFQLEGASGYPRTLRTSRGVRECIEHLLKWLRDLKLMYESDETQNTGGSVLVGVALYVSFTEVLPKVLKDHLDSRRPALHQRTAQQFSRNLSFFRSFSMSSTFRNIQGPNGLQLEDDDKVLNIDLQQSEWVRWEDVQNSLGGHLDSFRQLRCPVCYRDLDSLPEEERNSHANACLDMIPSGYGNDTAGVEW